MGREREREREGGERRRREKEERPIMKAEQIHMLKRKLASKNS